MLLVSAPRPPAHQISFAANCFELMPVVEWHVTPNPGSTAYPVTFDDRAAALAFARRHNRRCRRVETTRSRRIRWN